MNPSDHDIAGRPRARRLGNRFSRRFVPALLAAVVAVGLAVPAGALEIDSDRVVVPVVAHLQGHNGTQWRSDVWIQGISSNDLNVTLSYYPEAGGVLTETVQLEKYHGVFFHDIVLETFGLESSKGMLIVTADAPNVEVRARIYNTGNTCGEFGQAVPGLPLDRLSSQGFLSGLTTAAGTRLSIGIANPTDLSCSVNIYVRDAITNHRFSTHTIDLAPHQLVQLDRVADLWDLPQLDAISIEIRSDGDTKLIYAYGSVVRNDTGDATFVFGTSPTHGPQ
ncbi:MAG TPA: hypothetical protein ENK19_01525 [Acidobacteria bacterium]|nr:hypothetical protein [Acidobacteriota bacterium]